MLFIQLWKNILITITKINKMTKEQFKIRWESDENGGNISHDDIAQCAKEWGISQKPKCSPMDVIIYKVLQAANVKDADDYYPYNTDDED